MDDPFAKAKAIRKGTLDSELPSYDEITGWIQRVPLTWLPGLLKAVVFACVGRKVFQAGKLIPFAERCEGQANDPNHVLRE